MSYPTSINAIEGNKFILTDDVRWVEPTFPDVLSLELVKGNREALFKQSNTMLISESAASALFSQKDPIGQVVIINDKQATRGKDVEMVVTGVYKDYPQNSTFRHHYLFNLESLNQFVGEGYDLLNNYYFQLYVVLRDKSGEEKMEKFLDNICQEMVKDEISYAAGTKIFPIVRSLEELHFDSEIDWDPRGGYGNKKYLLMFTAISFLILLVACINYTNLTTARAASRAKEICIKRSFGSSRGRLIKQFLGESALLTLTALLLAIIISLIFLPNFNLLTEKNFKPSDFFQFKMSFIFFITATVVTLLSGSYPAIFLSNFKAVDLLKGNMADGKKAGLLRKSLIAIQFFVSIIITISTIALIKQMGLIYHSKLSEKGDQILAMRWGDNIPYGKFQGFKNTILQDPEIENVTMGNHLPRLDHFKDLTQTFRFPVKAEQEFQINLLNVGFDFPKTFDLEFIAGRDFDAANTSDSSSYVINEAVARLLGISYPEILNQQVDMVGNPVSGRIIGIVKDFPYKSMRHTIEPLLISPQPQHSGSVVFVRLPHKKIGEKKRYVESKWSEIIHNVGIESWFIDDIFDRMYKSENTITTLIKTFSALVIIINLFGLFGLASYLAERKKKEIGIRKVLGASEARLFWLFLWNFLRIFLITSIVALPLAYLIIQKWLREFAYRIDLDITIFVLGLLSLSGIIILTVSFEIIKAVFTNPVKTIRHE